MEDVQQSLPQLSLDRSPSEDMFSASVEAWKKNLDAFTEAVKPQPNQNAAEPQPVAEGPSAVAQASLGAEHIFRRAVEEQLELCRFFEKRWEQYLSLPDGISRCHSPVDLARLQLSFFTRMAADYGIEGQHFVQTCNEFVSEAMRFNPMPFFTRQPHH